MKYFIDAGAHLLESVKFFRDYFLLSQDYRVIAFEAAYDGDLKLAIDQILMNGELSSSFASFDFVPAAVAARSGLLTFYRDSSYSLSESSSLELEKARLSARTEVRRVPALCLSQIITDTVHEDDYCVLKIDIEGSDCDVVADLCMTGAIHLVNELYLELHDWKTRRDATRDIKLFHQLNEHGIIARSWDAAGIQKGKGKKADHYRKIDLQYISRLHSSYATQ